MSDDKLSPEEEGLIEEVAKEYFRTRNQTYTKQILRDFARKVIGIAETKDYEGMRHFQAKFIEADSALESAREEIARLAADRDGWKVDADANLQAAQAAEAEVERLKAGVLHLGQFGRDEMQARQATEAALSEIKADFQVCYDIATMTASYWPEASGVWMGTVSERLSKVFKLEHEAREKAEAALEEARAKLTKEERFLEELEGEKFLANQALERAEKAEADLAQAISAKLRHEQSERNAVQRAEAAENKLAQVVEANRTQEVALVRFEADLVEMRAKRIDHCAKHLAEIQVLRADLVEARQHHQMAVSAWEEAKADLAACRKERDEMTKRADYLLNVTQSDHPGAHVAKLVPENEALRADVERLTQERDAAASACERESDSKLKAQMQVERLTRELDEAVALAANAAVPFAAREVQHLANIAELMNDLRGARQEADRWARAYTELEKKR